MSDSTTSTTTLTGQPLLNSFNNFYTVLKEKFVTLSAGGAVTGTLTLNGNNVSTLIKGTDTSSVTSPALGMLFVNTSDNNMYYYDGSAWVKVIAVDDTYSADSSNAMSGKAVASAISTATSDVLTTSSTLDASKVSGTLPAGTYTDTTYVFNTTYDASTNKAATMADISSATSSISSGDYNVIESVKVGGEALAVDDKTVDIEVTEDSDIDGLFTKDKFTWDDGSVTAVSYATEGSLGPSDVPADS